MQFFRIFYSSRPSRLRPWSIAIFQIFIALFVFPFGIIANLISLFDKERGKTTNPIETWSMINTPENINIFIAYTPEDRPFVTELETHLNVLERLGLVDKIWYDGLVEAGADWETTVLNALHNSDIILLLVSADFIASDFCYHQEMLQAVRLHEEGKVQTIPIIVRPCLWDKAPFAKLKVLPKNGLPVATQSWNHMDEPYAQIAEAIEQIILQIKKEALGGDEQKRISELNRSIEEAEHYFAAGKWQEAQVKYEQALLFSKEEPGTVTDVSILNRRIEQCKSEIYFQLNFSRGEKAYREERYDDADLALSQALVFKPQDLEAQKLKAATDLALASAERKEKETAEQSTSGTRFLQVKVFGMEIFKLVIALCMAGVALAVIPQLLEQSSGPLASLEGGKVVFRNADGELVLATDYTDGRDFSEELAAVRNKTGKWGYIDTANQALIAFNYEVAWPHSEKEGLAYVRKDDKCGFIDREGKVKIPLVYLDAASFSEGLAMVRKSKKEYAFIDENGVEIISGLDGVITPQFRDGEAIVIRGGQQMTINKKGQCLEGCRKEDRPLSDSKKRRKIRQLLKESNQLVEQKEYERAVMKLKEAERLTETEKEKLEIGNRIDRLQRTISQGYKKEYLKIMDKGNRLYQQGDFIKALKFYEQALALPISTKHTASARAAECKAAIQRESRETATIYGFQHPNGQWGIKNAAREVLIAPRFDSVTTLIDGFIAVQEEGLWGFLDAKAKVAVTPRYDRVRPFSNGFAKVLKGRREVSINAYGREVNPREK